MITIFIVSSLPIITYQQVNAAPIISITRTSLPPKFGYDVGAAHWSFAANKFSWAISSSNMTLSLPSLTVAVASISCAIAQSSTFTHNTTTYTWTFSGASACNGVALTTSMVIHITNITGHYNQKEVYGKATVTKAGSSSIVQNVIFPFISSSSQLKCNSGSICTQQCFGNTCFDWNKLSQFTYNNSTKTLTAISGSSTASISTFTFDPLATDGSGHCTDGNSNTCNMTLSTSNTNDIIVVISTSFSGSGVGDFAMASDTAGLTYTNRAQICKGFTCASINAIIGIRYDYAISAGTLSSDSITCTQTGNTNARIDCVAFGISGADTSTIFDSGGMCNNTGTGTSASCTLPNTSNANDIILGLGSSDNNGGAYTAGTSFTLIQCGNGNCAATDPNGGAISEDYIVSTTQSGLSVAYTLGASHNWIIIGDAIKELSSVSYSFTLSPTVSYTATVTSINLVNTFSPSIIYVPNLNIGLKVSFNPSVNYVASLIKVQLGFILNPIATYFPNILICQGCGGSGTTTVTSTKFNTLIQTGDYSNFQSQDIALEALGLLAIICVIGFLIFYRR